jgi:drug/metabolite transporter (DMT)-like permease
VPILALVAVLLAALTHATWNLYAKRAAGSHHFVFLYSIGSLIIYSPLVLWALFVDQPPFTPLHWLALLGTGVLHTGYALLLQAGYRVSDLSLIYPIARGTGPLLSFIAATVLLNEPANSLSVLGVVLIVAGILMVSGLTTAPHKAPRAGIALGLLIGVFIASYTVNDGWAVKALMMSPFVVDAAGSAFRVVYLMPRVLKDPAGVRRELREYRLPVAVVAVLGPLGYILVLFAMRVAPVGHVAPARELATLVGSYFGVKLLKERMTPARVVGAILIVGGVISLAITRPT